MYFFKTTFKKSILLMLLMAILMPWAANAQETLTVYDGTDNNQYIPMYGYYFDAFAKSECIIPASELTDMDGGTISAITFYAKTVATTNSTWGNANQKVFIKEVDGTTLGGSYIGMTDATVVFEGLLNMPTTSTEGYTISFSEDYVYNGGNLLIGVYNDTKGKYNKVEWYGQSGLTSGVSAYGNNSSSLGSCSYNAQSFLPKTTFTYTPAAGGCAKPSMETPSNITSNSATISWTGGSGTFNVEYKKASEEEWTRRASNYNGYSVELAELEPSTSYQARVQSICENNVVSGWFTTSFDTPCDIVTTFPFHETFNDLTTSGQIPDCWNNNDGTTTNANYKWCYNSSYGTGHEGKCVSFDSYSNSSGNTNFLKTPVMNLPANKVMQLRFWYKNPAGGDFSVFISTDGGATYTTSLATGLTGQADWTEKEIVLANYTGQQNLTIVFKGTSNWGSSQVNNRLYLDDVYVEEAPTCPKQNGLNVTAVTSSSVTLDWNTGTNDQDHWDVFITDDASITPDASTTPTVSNTNQKPYTHTSLNPETVYFAFVRARCSESDQSPWTDACRFVTPQIPVAIDGDHPYDNDFETTNGWLFVNGDRPNQWWYGSAANNTENGGKAIYISCDNGATNSYTDTKGVVYATKAFSFAEGVYTFTYDWRAKGNQYYDYIRVALAPASTEIVATENLPTELSDTQLPTGWIALDGGSKLYNSDVWNTKVADEIQVAAGEYKMVVVWRNLTYGVTNNQPPAAIDNINISLLTCPRPTGLTTNNITGRTATVTWTENGTATHWVLQYATNNSFSENLNEVNVIETASKELTGLSPETKYYIRVKAVLDADESLWSDVADFTTTATCEKPTLSYVTNSNTAYSGSVSWTGSADGYEVAYQPTNDFDPSDYTLENVTRIHLGNVNTYTLENLTPETKYYIYVQADCGDEDGLSQWSNRQIFTTLATCVAPSYLTDESVTSSSANLSWTKGADDQNAWQFRYKKTSDSEYTYILVENHPANTYELTGLEPATSYYVNVRAWCGGDDYSKWSLANQSSDKTITTACGALTLPYTCDFEGAVETSGHFSSYPVPKCWDRIEMQYGSYSPYSYYPYVYNYSSDAHGGTKSLRMYRTPNSANQTIIMPEIDTQYEMSDLQIRFWAKAGSSNNTLSVGVMENNVFTEVQTVEGVSTTYAEFTVTLSDYTGNGRNIAIKCGSSSSYLYYNIDDITVEVIPSCLIPTGLTNTDVDVFTASFVWQAGKDETEWNFQYKKTSESEWGEIIHVTELPTVDNPFVLTGLQRGIEYEARIQAYCDAEDQSEWNAMPVSFTTDCGIWTIDGGNTLFEDFNESTFPPACWNWIKVDNYYGWQLSTNVYNPLDPQGTAYSYWPTGETYLILPHLHIDGAVTLNFDMAFSSSGSGEESSVVLSTTGFDPLNFTNILWTAEEFTTSGTNVNVDLSAYNGRDVYIAFKYVGVGTSGRTWYIDNVEVSEPTVPQGQQSVGLVEGWNWFSSYLDITLDDLKAALLEALGNTSITITSANGQSAIYTGTRWRGYLNSLDPTQMYKIETTTSCEMMLTGEPLDPAEHPVTITHDNNWIAYPFSESMTIEDAFAGFAVSGDMVISGNGQSTTYTGSRWRGYLTTLEPGQGYIYKSNASESRTFIFPTNNKSLALHKSMNEEPESHWSDFVSSQYKDQLPVVSFIQLDGDYITAEYRWDDLEIAAFVDGQCRGHAFMHDETDFGDPYPHVMVGVFYNNVDEVVTFKMYDHSTGMEYDNCISNIEILSGHEHVELYFDYDEAVVLNFATPTYTKEIIGYGEGDGRYYLIATPIDDMNPAEVDGMIAETEENYDLYWFDQTEELEWRNYKQGGGFNLVSGMGYLYANKDNTTLIFRGKPYDGDGAVSLVYDEDTHFPGWNLVGNPFTDTAYIGRDFYIMNPDGDRIIAATEDGIPAMEGVFVIAETDGEELIFSTTKPDTKNAMLALNLSNGNSVIDRAIVRFGDGRSLPKFQLNPRNSKVYIPQEGKDYAVVNMGGDAMHCVSTTEIPISFKAEENGTYTLSVSSPLTSNLSTLTLIDHLTGTDIDLLATPSYTFEAKTTDHANRFKLVFATSNDDTDDEFAYISNGQLIINGEGTLQIFDALGRQLFSKQLSVFRSQFSVSPGVYVLHLTNGNKTKTQKIVIE